MSSTFIPGGTAAQRREALGLASDPSTDGRNILGYRPADTAWLARFVAQDQAGANNAAITDLTMAAGALTFSGTGTLKTASNGIGGRNAIAFNGSTDKFTAATGAASLTGNFYVGIVMQFTSLAGGTGYQSPLCWGDATSAEERCFLKAPDHRISFANGAADTVVGTTNNIAAITTPYFIEAECVSGFIRVWVNGAIWATGNPTLSAYTATDILIGDDRFGSFLNGLVAEFFLLNSKLTDSQKRGMRSYIADTYGIVMADFGSSAPALSNLTGAAFTQPSAFPFQGTVAAHSQFGVHRFSNNLAFQGTLAIVNLSTNGFAGVTFGKPGSALECGAITSTLFSDAAGALSNPEMQVEASDFSDAAVFGTFRITQTKNSQQATRMHFRANGDIVFSNQIVNSNGSHADILTLTSAGAILPASTNTAGGSTGAKTIDKAAGTVNFAATDTSLVVTNALVTTASKVLAVVRTNDNTATIKNVVPADGSFTIRLTAAATAETSVGFLVIG